MLKPLLTAAGGALVGFWIAKVRYEKAAYAYATERIEQAKAYAEERADRQIQKFQAETESVVVEQIAKVFEVEQDRVDEILEGNPKFEKLITNYQGFSTPQPMPTVVKEDSESHIQLIRRKEFFEGPLEADYDQVSVTYYQIDDVLLDPYDKQLDVAQAVGNIRPDWFGNEADDENVCYVRNTKNRVEFEVNRSQSSYAKDVLGIGGDGK
jgi:hypothetical protein